MAETTSLLRRDGYGVGGDEETVVPVRSPGSDVTTPRHLSRAEVAWTAFRSYRAVVGAAICFAFVSGVALGVSIGGGDVSIFNGLTAPAIVPTADLKDGDGQPVVTVGFESSGDFYWLPMVKLLEAALPGVKIRLTDPTYNWRAMGLGETVGAANVEVVDAADDVDLVVEGPNIFKSSCLWVDKPWVQATAEPTMFFNTWDWCEHKDPAMLRLDTGLAHYKQEVVYDENVTTFVWSPYAMTHTWFMHEQLVGRGCGGWAFTRVHVHASLL